MLGVGAKTLTARLAENAAHHRDVAASCDCAPEHTANWRHALDDEEAIERITELEAALRTAQSAIAKCLSEGGRLDGGPDADWWSAIIAAQQNIAAALRR